MGQAEIGTLPQFLNYGGLGLLAIACLVVLGYNVWSLNALIAKAQPQRITAARPLLLAQMGISLVGLFAVGFAAVYLDGVEKNDRKVRIAQVIIDPWDMTLDEKMRPEVKIVGEGTVDRMIEVMCKPEQSAKVMINLTRFIDHRIEERVRMNRVLIPIAADVPADAPEG